MTKGGEPPLLGKGVEIIGSLFRLIGTMISNVIGNGYHFHSKVPLKKYVYSKQTTR